MLAQHLTRYFSSGEVPVRAGSANSGLGVPYQAFQAADDWIVIASFNERMWRDCCAALDHPEWADDPRFRTADLRGQHRDLLLAMFTKVVAQHPVKYWEERLRARQVPATPR